MKIIIKFIVLITLIHFLYSCASESNIFDGSIFYLSKQDSLFLVDSFKVVKVIDNRIHQDSIIGEADYDKKPLIINRPLKDYLKMSLNSLICKDTNQTEKIPITVYIDDFYLGRESSFFDKCVYNKYSYLFEYPYKDQIRRVRIFDSVALCGAPEMYKQRIFIKDGLRYIARLFLYNHFNNYPNDTINKEEIKSEDNRKDIDTMDLIKLLKVDSKSCARINIYRGFKIDYGIQISYLNFFSRPGIKFEFGLGYAIQYSKVTNGDILGTSIDLSIPFYYRFNFSEQKNEFYVELSYSISGETENRKNNFNGFYLGTRLQESIGYNIADYFTISLGLYQEGHINTNLLPYDIGFALSLSLSDLY